MKLAVTYSLFFFILTFCACIFAVAAEPEAVAANTINEGEALEENSEVQSENDINDDGPSEELIIEAADDTFVPSIQISEDLSVSFPVNI